MGILKISDFYYGAFLSALLNTPGGRPSLFDETSSRRIYRLETNNNEDTYFFTKYTSGKENKTGFHWVFKFTSAEIDKLKELHHEKGKVQVVLIGIKDGFADSEIAIVDYNTAMKCLGVEAGVKGYRINLKAIENERKLRVYGSGLSDILNGKDNTFKIPRNALATL